MSIVKIDKAAKENLIATITVLSLFFWFNNKWCCFILKIVIFSPKIDDNHDSNRKTTWLNHDFQNSVLII